MSIICSQPTTTATGIEPLESPLSVESETDVKAFAEAMVQIMEKAQSPIPEETSQEQSGSSKQVEGFELEANLNDTKDRNLTSTPVPEAQTVGENASSTSLEASLQIAPSSRTQLTELLPVQTSDELGEVGAHHQLEDDISSSLHDAPHCLMGSVLSDT